MVPLPGARGDSRGGAAHRRGGRRRALVRVAGYELVSFEPNGLLCHFGADDPQTARVLSSVLVVCESTAHEEGAVALEVSSSGPMGGYTSATFEYAEPPVPVALRPASGPAEGGGVLFLSLAGAEAWTAGSSLGGAAAQFGTVWPLAARRRGRRGDGGARARPRRGARLARHRRFGGGRRRQRFALCHALRPAGGGGGVSDLVAHPRRCVGRRHRGQGRGDGG